MSYQKLGDYLFSYVKLLLNNLIDHQQGCPGYTHENNIAVGISYEECVANLLDDLKHISQELENYIKRDIIYFQSYIDPITSNIKTYIKSLEFKSGFSNLLNNLTFLMNYAKKNGNEEKEKTRERILKTLPDGLLFYQKYNIEYGIAALIGFISKETLIRLANECLSDITNTNVFFKISLKDFEWYVVEEQIPIKKDGYIEANKNLEKELKQYEKLKKKELSEQYNSDKFSTCDNHKVIYKNASTIKKFEKPIIKEKIKLLQNNGKSLYDISKETKIRPNTIKNWISKDSK